MRSGALPVPDLPSPPHPRYPNLTGAQTANLATRYPTHRKQRGGNNLSDVIEQRGLGDAIYYDRKGEVISIEDPSFRLYLTLADISEIERSVRVRKTRFPWDVAVSFAGEDREVVERFRELLNNAGYAIFYDFDEQHKLWGENLRRKLGEVYAHDAQYMVVFLSKNYPEKDWASFEF